MPDLPDDLMSKLRSLAIEAASKGAAAAFDAGFRRLTAVAAAAASPKAKPNDGVFVIGGKRKTAYQILGVLPDVPYEVAQAAYRVLAKQHHPDATTDPEEKQRREARMKILNAAMDWIERKRSAAGK